MQKQVNTALPKSVQKYIGHVWGNWAPGARIPVDTPLAACQRDLKIQNVYRYISQSGGLDRDLFGYATAVRRRSDGALALINGQHRIQLVRIISPETQEVPAQVIEVDDADFETYASDHFHKINGTAQRRLTNEEIFYAQVLAQDVDAQHLARVLKQAGLCCGRVHNNISTHAVEYATFAKCVRLGETETIRAAQLLIDSFGRVNTDVLHGLVFLLSHPHYQILGDPTRAQGQQFEDWFRNLGTFVSISDLKFERYRQGPWQKGIAYGIAQAFARYQRNRGRSAPTVGVMEDIWRQSWAPRDSGVLSGVL